MTDSARREPLGDVNTKSDAPFYTNKIFIIGAAAVGVVALIVIIAVCASGGSSTPKKEDEPSYGESTTLTPKGETNQFVMNPDQGMYGPLIVNLTEQGLTNQTFYDVEQVYHCRISIAPYSKVNNGKADIPFSENALNYLRGYLNKIRAENRNAIVRFAYDGFNGKNNTECEISMIQTHIKQLGPVLNEYKDVIVAIEAGFLGPWGEMHSSKIATPENKNIVFDTWLKNTDKIPVLARTPLALFHYCGKETLEEMQDVHFDPSDIKYYLGIFNDGMFATDDDYGTFRFDRAGEIKWMGGQNDHLPYGGECVYRDAPDCMKIKNAIPEMYIEHMSYMNMDFDEDVFYEWKKEKYNSTISGHSIFDGVNGYEFIKAHLGYRIVATKITINKESTGNKFKADIELKHNGYGFVNKVKNLGLVYVDTEGNILLEENNLGTYTGNATLISVKGNLPDMTKDYSAYLRLYYEITGGVVKYAIRFANEGIFNEKAYGNLIFNVKDGKIQ
ncbi:MAG: DUF4832 domain-containing protein [archaeon]|nr:DUF4832 domain-containing protein [archaeon]